MPKATHQYNLSVMNPRLAKEWHPSRNGDLTPRNVTPGSGKKVWWICISGHEWQAAVYSRNRGSGCPVCNRPTSTDNHETLITNTDLRKEWHLTKNSGLNLRNLPPGFNKKVWWICEEGHEWQATVKSRTKGRGCPDCNKDLSRKDSLRKPKLAQRSPKISIVPVRDSAKPLFPQSSAATGFRKNKRFLHRVTVILEDTNSGAWSYAQTKDLSSDGMLLESEVAFKPGTTINIKFDTQPFKSAPKTYRSVVRWCKEVSDSNSSHSFGIGVKFT
ncbi:MAG: zinc-ribbon domain-containing protein [Desulfobacterales bacterium]